MNHCHVIGAGLAGLSASLALTAAGRGVTLYEAGPQAGGRCRSYHDRELGLTIDNGNHLLLSGNTSTFAYIRTIGTTEQFSGPGTACFPFYDLRTHERWSVRPNQGRLPWWVLSRSRRVPGSRLSDYYALASIARIDDDTVVADTMRRGRLYWLLLEPFAIAALNTPPNVALARLLGAVIQETLMRGGSACIPCFPRIGLSAALIDPAVALLQQRGATVQFGRRVGELLIENERVVGLRVGDTVVPIAEGDSVVLAVPPWVASSLLPGLIAPDRFEAILNIHFRMDVASDGPAAEAGFVGLIRGTAEWVFVKPGHVSVTISAANRLVDEPAEDIAHKVWMDVRRALDLSIEQYPSIPPFRVVKEKRATFAATAAQEERRPEPRTHLANLVLAGDWTATGLPATIEGAIRSGEDAAALLLEA